MDIALVPCTQTRESVLCGLGLHLLGLAHSESIDVDLGGDGWAGRATVDLHGPLRDAALLAAHDHLHGLTETSCSEPFVERSTHPDRLDRLYDPPEDQPGDRYRLAGPEVLSGQLRVAGLAMSEGSRRRRRALRPAMIEGNVLLIELDISLPSASSGPRGIAAASEVTQARQAAALELLSRHAIVVWLGIDRPADDAYATALASLLDVMTLEAGLAAHAAQEDDADGTTNTAVRLKRIVIAVDSVGQTVAGAQRLLTEYDADTLFQLGALPLLRHHASIVKGCARLAGNIRRVSGRDVEVPLICVPMDLAGDIPSIGCVNRDPLAPALERLRSRDFSIPRGRPLPETRRAIVDAVRPAWRPFNVVGPLLAASGDFAMFTAMELSETDWLSLEEGLT
ncbi:MAG: hypothetical protein AAGF09_04265 [Pseudomonadota bacterium]